MLALRFSHDFGPPGPWSDATSLRAGVRGAAIPWWLKQLVLASQSCAVSTLLIEDELQFKNRQLQNSETTQNRLEAALDTDRTMP